MIVEAGTGTGKTFAYLVPALLSGRSVIISTGTRTLQDQLFRRDVPLLADALGLPVKIALLKGRTNYLCRHRLELATQQGSLLDGERGAARTLARISRWAATTKAGDLSELTDLPEQSPVWPQITSTRENCLGSECPQFARCHVVEARRNAQAADIVVVNHHLLLADLALKDEGFGDLLAGGAGRHPGRSAPGAGYRGAVLRPGLVGAPGAAADARHQRLSSRLPRVRAPAYRRRDGRPSMPGSRNCAARLQPAPEAL